MSTFTGRTAIVTGASRNIGRAIAIGFARAGIGVAAHVGSDLGAGQEVVEEAHSLGVDAMVTQGDLSDPDAVDKMLTAVSQNLGVVSYLVSCAAVRPLQPFLDISVEDWDRVIRLNLSATFYLTRLLLPDMAEQGFGRIISIGGPDGQTGSTNRAHNVACKAGLIGLTKAIALEFGPLGVTANVVVPGIMDTTRVAENYPGWPPNQEELDRKLCVPRLGESSEVADACVFLASDQASYITGQTLHVSGGMVMP